MDEQTLSADLLMPRLAELEAENDYLRENYQELQARFEVMILFQPEFLIDGIDGT